jgi:Cu/Ag efflux protein CusF
MQKRARCFMTGAALFLLLVTLVACNKDANQPTVAVPPQATAAKRYHLQGKVVSVDKRANMLNVDGEAIPGLMAAMTMPYNVKPETQLDKLSPGDAITADVVVQGDNSWLENIAVTGHSSAPASK